MKKHCPIQIPNEAWLEANLDPQNYRSKLGIGIPDLPSDEIQVRFNGRAGRENLQQAFDFYNFVLTHQPDLYMEQYDVLDFGGGWGRVLRMFLREFPAERLVLVDCLTAAIECGRSLNGPFNIIHTEVNPPLPLLKGTIGIVYAYSVFSHLPEQLCCDWFRHFTELLIPGGKLIFTTRGLSQLDYIDRLEKTDTPYSLARYILGTEVMRERYDRGVFQFYPAAGGGELTSENFGETWIPKPWLEERHRSLGFSGCEFYTEFETVDQCVFVLTK